MKKVCCWILLLSTISLAGLSQSQNSAQRIPLPPRYDKWLKEDVRWIITDEERKDFKKLTSDVDRDRFIDRFWERRNPTPGAVPNLFKVDHYRRIECANSRFGYIAPDGKETQGWRSDRGRIYIMYGPPDSTKASTFTDREGTFPTEVWHYSSLRGHTGNVDLSFIDTCKCGDYRMQMPEADRNATDKTNWESVSPLQR